MSERDELETELEEIETKLDLYGINIHFFYDDEDVPQGIVAIVRQLENRKRWIERRLERIA